MTFYRSPMTRRPFQGLLWPKEILEVFNDQNTFKRSFNTRRPLRGQYLTRKTWTGLLEPEDLAEVFYDQMTIYWSKVFHGQKNLTGPLWPESISEVV